ncbi:MAG: TIGR02147 family protein [Bdellovibrionota bacterium]
MKNLSPIELSYFKIWLQEEFTRRCRVNSRYSLRAFAKSLALDPSTVSQMLSGKRKVSQSMLEKIESKIGMAFVFDSENLQQSMGKKYSLLSKDLFAAISDWYHFAILDLTLLKNFDSNPSWIAQQLGISVTEVSIAIDRLKRLELLAEQDSKLVKTQMSFSNYKEGDTSAAHKEYQRQIVEKSLHAIDGCPQDLKDITSMTIAGNSKKLIEVKDVIKKFRRELAAFMEDGDGDAVFHLAVQLYPVTSLEKREPA